MYVLQADYEERVADRERCCDDSDAELAEAKKQRKLSVLTFNKQTYKVYKITYKIIAVCHTCLTKGGGTGFRKWNSP